MIKQTLISVIIPCYNQGSFLQEAYTSVLNQTYTNWEAYIIDDGSTDETKNISKKICSQDNRFKYIYQKNKGLSAARNTGLKNSQGEFIQFLDADDKITSTKFMDSLNLIKSDNADIVVSNFLRFKSKNGKEKKAHFKLENFEINFDTILVDWDQKYTIPIHCALFSKKIIGNNQFNENLKAKEDWVFWLDVFHNNNPKVFFNNKKQALYRAHSNNISKKNNLMFKNWETANNFIFDKLNDSDKQKFFTRINSELSENRVNYLLFKQNTLSRKILHTLKHFLNSIFKNYVLLF